MKGEIDKDLYCITGFMRKTNEKCFGFNSYLCTDNVAHRNGVCPFVRYKWPTPEQYEKEYGRKYPDDAAVYVLLDDSEPGIWHTCDFNRAKLLSPGQPVVCACTPFGEPPEGWMPGE